MAGFEPLPARVEEALADWARNADAGGNYRGELPFERLRELADDGLAEVHKDITGGVYGRLTPAGECYESDKAAWEEERTREEAERRARERRKLILEVAGLMVAALTLAQGALALLVP